MAARAPDPDQFALSFDAPAAPTVAAEIAVPPSLSGLARPALRRTRAIEPGRSRRRSFVVGRLNRSSREMRVLDRTPTPIPGPWALHAMVHAPGSRLRLV